MLCRGQEKNQGISTLSCFPSLLTSCYDVVLSHKFLSASTALKEKSTQLKSSHSRNYFRSRSYLILKYSYYTTKRYECFCLLVVSVGTGNKIIFGHDEVVVVLCFNSLDDVSRRHSLRPSSLIKQKVQSISIYLFCDDKTYYNLLKYCEYFNI